MIKDILNRIQNWDKIVHMGFGAIAALSPWYPILAILVVAFGKEVYDYYHRDKHTSDGADAVALVRGDFLFPHGLGDHAEHCAAIQLLAAGLNCVDAQATKHARFE